MNKVLLVGRLVRDPETQSTQSGIKWSRFTIAVSRPFGEEQTDFIPIVAWRSQAEFIEKYMTKGSLVSVEGRFTSSSYRNNNNEQVTRYEVTADRVEALETKAARDARVTQEMSTGVVKTPPSSAANTQVIQFAEENKPADKKEELESVPWDLDL